MAFLDVIKLETAEQLMEALKPWGSSFEVKNYIFRGHSDANYQLVPSALRNKGDHLWRDETSDEMELSKRRNSEVFQTLGEFSILAEFYKLADRRGLPVPVADRIRSALSYDNMLNAMLGMVVSEWIPDDFLEIAALAQHYGVPTSLLDWSYDPFTAAYFAAQTAKNNKEPEEFCVWGLNRSVLSGICRVVGLPLRFVTPHMAGNQNIYAQSGVFTLWQRKVSPEKEKFDVFMRRELSLEKPLVQVDRRGLDEHLKESIQELMELQNDDTELDEMFNVFKKFVVSSSEKARLNKMLRDADLGPSRIFPGYGGCATEVFAEKVPQILLSSKNNDA